MLASQVACAACMLFNMDSGMRPCIESSSSKDAWKNTR